MKTRDNQSSANTTEQPSYFDFSSSLPCSNSKTYDDRDSSCSQTCEDQVITYFQTIRPEINQKVSALDVAAYVLKKTGRISTMKLQKLVYYCQAWSLVWDEHPLFYEPIEAWANGPVVKVLFNYHRGMFDIERVLTGNPDILSDEQIDTIDAVLEFYGDKSAQWLIDLSHSETPWVKARRGLSSTARGNLPISEAEMAEYYSSL